MGKDFSPNREGDERSRKGTSAAQRGDDPWVRGPNGWEIKKEGAIKHVNFSPPHFKNNNKTKCPKWYSLLPPSDFYKLPLNVKEEVINSLQSEKVKNLSMREETKQHLLKALKWIEDPDFYSGLSLPPFRKYQSRFSKKDEKLLNKKMVSLDNPRCSVKGFSVGEIKKNRRRPIFWPDLNKSIGKNMLLPNKLPSRERTRADCISSSTSVVSTQFDFTSFYDQIALPPAISRFFSFKGKQCLGQLPMGFRPAVEVAHAITMAICDFVYLDPSLASSVNTSCYIDNVRFVGEKEKVKKAAKIFLERCKEVGAILGEEHPPLVQEDDFLGEHYNYVTKTRKITDKVMEKIKYVEKELDKMNEEKISFRRLAAMFGVLFYASDVINAPLCFYFNALRFFRSEMSKVTSKAHWDEEVQEVFNAEAHKEMQLWINFLKTNEAVPIIDEEDTEEYPFVSPLTLYIDSSAFGWGGISIFEGGIKMFSGEWGPAEQGINLGSSVCAEPLGIQKVVGQALFTGVKEVVIHTDHLPLVYAGNRGYGKAYTYNELLVFLKQHYPTVNFRFKFIKGKHNTIADFLSRNKKDKNFKFSFVGNAANG